MASCDHLDATSTGEPDARVPDGCEECLAIGSRWVHLRKCTEVWSRGLLRLLAQQARHRSPP